jgi:uncharacterized protein
MFEIASIDKLLMGLGTGLVFGFLLQRAGVTRFRTILGQFLWKDHTVLRTMLTAVVVGAAGIYAMQALSAAGLIGAVSMHVKGAAVLANVLGGLIFGVGMVILGYCPGTGVAAIGEGSRHAVPGLLGMLAGAAFYAEVHPWAQSTILGVCDLGKQTLPGLTGLSPWVFIAALVVSAVGLFALLHRSDRSQAPSG